MHHAIVAVLAAAAIARPASSATTHPGVLELRIDAREAPRRILHAHLNLPVEAGPLALRYPKWIPGEHGPSGPIVNLANLHMTAGGETLAWRRDPADMFTFHVDVPVGVRSLAIDLDDLLAGSGDGFSAASSASEHLAVISWNQLVLYPADASVRDLLVEPSVELPPGWSQATSLDVASSDGAVVRYAPISLEMLVDSPVQTGDHIKTIALTPEGAAAPVAISLAADSAAALDVPPATVEEWKRLVKEAVALFGARHYRRYLFLLTLSEDVAHFGLEHHESSDDRLPERTFLTPESRLYGSGLLPHEHVHSWNGKYRRPADFASPDFHEVQRTDLLWVYEGLTQYLGMILTPRSGLETPAQAREEWARTAALMASRSGRQWRPLVDTAIAAQDLYEASNSWQDVRREVDFYPEGALIWLEADVLIRQQTKGKASLDDFCRRFHGGKDGPPAVAPYTLDDVVAALNAVAPRDWRAFLDERVEKVAPKAPLAGIEEAGWKLAYTDKPNEVGKARAEKDKIIDLSSSLGIVIGKEGEIPDVTIGMPAAQAGIGPGMKLVAVNGRKWSDETIEDAMKASKTSPDPLKLLVQNGEFFRTFRVDWHGGERYPHLVRDKSKPDLLSKIFAPLTPVPKTKAKPKEGEDEDEDDDDAKTTGN